MKSAPLKDVNHHSAADITFQDASLDIWDVKYRLKDKDGQAVDHNIDETYQRVARALSDVEDIEQRQHWYEEFLWALRHGAIPAGLRPAAM